MESKGIIHLPNWIRGYRKTDFRFDLIAGITVGVMLIPQAMAYAMLAGLPPIYGLYASTIPPVAYALFGTCRQLSVGPAAMISLLTASGIGLIALPGTENYIGLVILMTLCVGLIQFTLGVARLGFLIHFLSNPVILGFSSAAVVLIGLSQLKYFLGISIGKSQYLHDIIYGVASQISHTHLLTLAMGSVGLALLLGFRKKWPSFPGPLVVVTLAILITWIFRLDQQGMGIVGDIPQGFPFPAIPELQFTHLPTIISTAFAIALISFMESTAVSRAVQARHRDYKIVPNKELMALGLSNMTSAFFRAMPVTGGLSRTIVNDQAGARSGMATIVCSILILLTLLFFTPAFYFLPTAILAAIVIAAVTKFIRVDEIFQLWKLDRKDFWMMLATFISTLFLGITVGIGIGVMLSLAWIIYESSYPHHAELGRVPGTNTFRNTRRFNHLEVQDGVLIFRFDAPLFFANATRFHEVLTDYLRHRQDPIHAVIVDMESNNSIDSSAIKMLADLVEEMKGQGIQVNLAEVKGPVRDKLFTSGIAQSLGEHRLFVTIDDAMRHCTGKREAHLPSVAFQTNVPRE